MCWWVHRAHTQPPPLCGHLTFISFFASPSYRPPSPPPPPPHTHTHTHFWQHFIYVSFSQYCPNETRDKHKNQTMKKNRCFMFRKLEMLQVTKKKRLFVEHRALLPNIAQMKHGKNTKINSRRKIIALCSENLKIMLQVTKRNWLLVEHWALLLLN